MTTSDYDYSRDLVELDGGKYSGPAPRPVSTMKLCEEVRTAHLQKISPEEIESELAGRAGRIIS